MNTTINASLVAVVTAVIYAAAPSSAHAQGNTSSRPYKALFGGSATDPDIRHSFDVSLSVLGAYDDNGQGQSTAASPLYQTGFYTGLSGGVTYAWQGKTAQVGANVGADTRYYSDQSSFIGTNQFGGIRFSAALGERMRVAASQSITHTPAYLYGLFPGADQITPGEAVGVGNPLGEEHVFVYDTSANLSRDISERGSVQGVGEFRYSDYNQAGTIGRDLQSYSIGGRYRHAMTRYTSMRLGYVYRRGRYGFVGDVNRPTAVHDIEVGVEYRHLWSRTRQTTLSFSLGPSIVDSPIDVVEATPRYRVVGDVNLTHQLGRTWSTNISYNRGVGFMEGFGRPTFSDAVTGTMSGFFSQRIDFSASGGVSIGDAGLNAQTDRRGFKAYTASARVRYAIASMWALFAEYSYYKHSLGDVLIVAEGVPPDLDRNTARAGLTLWVPILKR